MSVNDDLLARRELTRSDGTPVHVILERPQRLQDGSDWICRWRIETVDGIGATSFHSAGADSMQAVFLSLKMIGATLAHGHETYLFHGQTDLGFP